VYCHFVEILVEKPFALKWMLLLVGLNQSHGIVYTNFGRRDFAMSSRLGRSTPQPLSIKTPVKPSSSNASTPVTNLTVEEWESKAPLDDMQIRSVAALKNRTENIPLPYKVCRVIPTLRLSSKEILLISSLV
jgi:hypothetical protein